MSTGQSWEAFLARCFPGYLLPEALLRAMPEDEAVRFLARLGGGSRAASLLRAASVAAAHAGAIREYALVALPALAAHLPARSRFERRVARGELRGRLDVPGTIALRNAGRGAELAARGPRPARDRPEDVLARAVAVRLRDLLRGLSEAGVLGTSGWGAEVMPCADALARTLDTTALRDVPDQPVGGLHEEAARLSSHPAHALAAALWRAIDEGVDDPDPAVAARRVAEGALAPLADHTRFELAVLLRLVEAVAERFPGGTLERRVVASGRRAVTELRAPRGARIRFYYDQAFLDPGPYDAAVRRYFGPRGRLRPDVTMIVDDASRRRAVLVEAKLSSDPDYLAQSYRDALVYRAEYGAALSGWPQVVLVTAAPIAGAPSREDEVIAVGWDRWVPDDVLDGMVEGV